MPNYTPPRLSVISLAAIISLSACATVDVTGYAAPSETISAVKPVEKGNIITRTVMRLYNVFVDRGLYEDTSRKRVQSAANILLNGLKTPDSDAADQTAPAAVHFADFSNDVQTARYHITQTTKAAEVYLDIASNDSDLSEELKQLQKALRVSEKAADRLAQHDVQGDQAGQAEILGLQAEVNKLRSVTDAFGDVVRARRIAAASKAAS